MSEYRTQEGAQWGEPKNKGLPRRPETNLVPVLPAGPLLPRSRSTGDLPAFRAGP
jgi:hypothetical protein